MFNLCLLCLLFYPSVVTNRIASLMFDGRSWFSPFVARWTWGFVCPALGNIYLICCGNLHTVHPLLHPLFLFGTKMCLGSRYCICTRTGCSHTDPLGVGWWDLCCSYWTGWFFFSSCCTLLFFMKPYLKFIENINIIIYIRDWSEMSTTLLYNPDLIGSSYMYKVRVPVGRLILELPAGMLDDDKGDFVGTAAREVSLC